MSEPVQLGWDLLQDPHRYLDDLRMNDAVHHVVLPHGVRVWLVTDYALAKDLLADPRLSNSRRGRGKTAAEHGSRAQLDEQDAALTSEMLFLDPPDHTRLRKLVNHAFTPRRVTAMRPRIEQVCATLLGALPNGTEIDLLDRFAFPLTITVIGELLGVPQNERDQLRKWVDTMASTAVGAEAVRRAHIDLVNYFRRRLVRTREEPDEAMLSALIDVSDDTDRLSEDELLSMMTMLLTAGYDSTANLIGNAVLTLSDHPEQLAGLRQDPSRIPDALEEVLRFNGSVAASTVRFTTEPVACGAVTIPIEAIVVISLLAANHDDAQFEAAGTFDPDRGAAGHLAFGRGIHFCLGAQLARLQGEVALRGLLERFDGWTVDTTSLSWRDSLIIHGVERLPVRLARRS